MKTKILVFCLISLWVVVSLSNAKTIKTKTYQSKTTKYSEGSLAADLKKSFSFSFSENSELEKELKEKLNQPFKCEGTLQRDLQEKLR